MRVKNPTKEVVIPESGLLLKPGELYLGSTNEEAGSDIYVPMLEGRSSLGRLGVYIHVTAGVGDVGFKKRWTLELTVVKPVIIYPNIRVGQVMFHTAKGNTNTLYTGKYSDSKSVEASRIHEDFNK